MSEPVRLVLVLQSLVRALAELGDTSPTPSSRARAGANVVLKDAAFLLWDAERDVEFWFPGSAAQAFNPGHFDFHWSKDWRQFQLRPLQWHDDASYARAQSGE